jgi:ketosteroid isomerase-like protein
MLGQGLGVTPFWAMLRHLALTRQDTATTLVHVGATHPFRADTESIATRAVYPSSRDAFARELTRVAADQPDATFLVSGIARIRVRNRHISAGSPGRPRADQARHLLGLPDRPSRQRSVRRPLVLTPPPSEASLPPMPSIPTYHSIVKKNIVTGRGVDDHDYAALADHFAPDLHHRFAGRHALGGERHDAATVLAWLERVGRVLPDLTFAITDVTVAGWPHDTTVVARWNAHAPHRRQRRALPQPRGPRRPPALVHDRRRGHRGPPQRPRPAGRSRHRRSDRSTDHQLTHGRRYRSSQDERAVSLRRSTRVNWSWWSSSHPDPPITGILRPLRW